MVRACQEAEGVGTQGRSQPCETLLCTQKVLTVAALCNLAEIQVAQFFLLKGETLSEQK